MICVAIFGGLGNQMFQYAFGRALAFKFNTELVIDDSFFKKGHKLNYATERSYDLLIYKLPVRKVTSIELYFLRPLYLRIVNVISINLGFGGIQNSKYFVENSIGINKLINRIGLNCYITGYWQCYKYFENVDDLLRKEFSFPEILDIDLIKVLTKIKKECSVSIHIRRGDYLNPDISHTHALCSFEYYNNAIIYMNSHLTNISYYIFSDDINWVKENFVLPANTTFISGNNGKNNYIDMQLMSECKHNIIANSSFSWWAAWLNTNVNKIIVAPKLWYSNELHNLNTIDLIPDSWVRL